MDMFVVRILSLSLYLSIPLPLHTNKQTHTHTPNKQTYTGTLQLLCRGAKIHKDAIEADKTELLGLIEDKSKRLLDCGPGANNLYSKEEKEIIYCLSICLVLRFPGNAGFNAFCALRSFITYKGIFMGPGYSLGKGSVWKKK
jgi:hypothetical protein